MEFDCNKNNNFCLIFSLLVAFYLKFQIEKLDKIESG